MTKFERTTDQRLNRAAPFRVDERMEALLRMRRDDPAGFRQLSPGLLISVGLYEGDRDQHNDITGGAA